MLPLRLALGLGDQELEQRLRPALDTDAELSVTVQCLAADQVMRALESDSVDAIVVSIATFMEVLDTSIANVALPHIAGSLSAGQDESTWVLTSYLVANAIILPSGEKCGVSSLRFSRVSCVSVFVPKS